MMERRRWGALGIVGSAIGFGVSGPLATPLVSDADVARLVSVAIELGLTVFDVAPHDGRAERRLGAALAQSRAGEDVVIVTKAGKRRAVGGLVADFSPGAVLASIEESRRRLGRDRLDAVLLHGPSPDVMTAALLEALATARAQGWIRAFGVTGRGAEIDAAIARGFGALVQTPVFSETAQRAASAGAVVIGIEALRATAPQMRAPRRVSDLWYLARAAKAVSSAATPVAEAPEVALDRALKDPAVACVLTTTTRVAHLRANAARAVT